MSAVRRFAILIGNTGQGKSSLAESTGILVACERFSLHHPDACGVCAGCRDFLEHPGDYLCILRGNRSLEDILEGISGFLYRNVKKAAVIFIDEIGFLTKEALGELLDVLDGTLRLREERGQKIYVLFASTPELMGERLRSLQSRCTTIPVANLTVNQIAQGLITIADQHKLLYNPEALYTVAGAADYGMRNAVNMLATLAEKAQKITEELVRQVLALPPEGEYLDVFRNLNINAFTTYEQAARLLEKTDAPIFRDGLLRSFAALNQIGHGVPVSRSLSDDMSQAYQEISRGYHPVEFSIMCETLYARRFIESQNADHIVTMLLSLSYRLCNLEFRDLTPEEWEDHAISMKSQAEKREFT